MVQFIAKTPLYDVFGVLNTWWLEVQPYLQPFDAFMKKSGFGDPHDAFGALVDNFVYEGQTYAFPIRAGCGILFYRKDWFRQAGVSPPKDLDELLQVARKITKDTNGDGKTDRFGMSLKLESDAWTIETFSDFFMPNGGWYLTEDLTQASPSLRGPAATKAMETMKSLWEEKLIPDPFGWTYHDVVSAFQTGHLGMADEQGPRVLFIEDPAASEAAGKMGYAELPSSSLGSHRPATYGWAWGFAINSQSDVEKQEAAYKFIEYMARLDNQKIMAMEYANGPTIQSIFDDPDYLAVNPAAAAIKATFRKGTRVTTPVAQAKEIQVIIHEEIQAMMFGEISIQQASSNIYDRINKAMKVK